MSERSIFLSALDIEEESARNAYLDEACGSDTRLRSEIESLLRSHVEAGSFLGTPAVQQAESAPLPTVMLGSSDDSAAQVIPPKLGPAAVERDETEAAILSLLQPPERAGSLGRLAHYEVLEVLGKGAFGVVLKAFDEKLHRLVAIKAMNPEMAATSPPRKRFLREARSSAAVKDEHIVSIYAVEEQPIPYLVMEYVAGLTLQQYLDEHGPLDLLDVLRIGQQIAAGLAAAHDKGLIHRDIKPANILLETGLETRAKITDFGLARATDDASLTQSGLIAGTPMFMAPEQAKGQALDHRADLFSLGSVLYTMVSGRPPFRAPNTIAVLKRVCEDTPRPIRELIPETPGWLCDIIAKLHAKEPENRFQSANDVRQALSDGLAYLQNPAGTQRPVIQNAASATMPSGTQRSGKSRTPAWLFVVLALCLLPVLGCPMLLIVGLAIPAYKAAGSRTTITVPDDAAVRITDDGSPSNAGWQPLFNGVDLTGWETHPDQPGRWRVENGHLVGSGSVSHLFHVNEQPVDFEFRGEVRLNDNGNSGVFVRTPFELTSRGQGLIRPPGYEVELVAGNQPNSGKGPASGSLMPLSSPAGANIIQPRQWFKFSVKADGDHFDVWIDDVHTVSVDGPTMPSPGGRIALQVGVPGTRVEFRNLEIRSLRDHPQWIGGDSTPAAVSEIRRGTPSQTLPSSQFPELVQLADLARQELVDARRLHESGQMAAMELSEAEIAVTEAELKLAQATRDSNRQQTLFGELIAKYQERLDVTRRIVEGGEASQSELRKAERSLLEVEHRAAAANLSATLIPSPTWGTWQPLFNGSDLTGWKVHPAEPGQWRVENGILIGSGTPSCLFSERGDFTDFELHCEVSISQDGDGGVLVRTPFELPDKDGLPGYEAQIQSGRVLAAGWTTGAIGQSDRGTGWRMKQAAATSVTNDAFFPLVVKVVGNHIETFVSGSKVAEYDDPDRKYVQGHIALQQSGPNTQIKFRKIEIRELSVVPAEVAAPATTTAPWIDLLKAEKLTRYATSDNGARFEEGALLLSVPGFNDSAQAWLESLSLRHARMRAVVQAVGDHAQSSIGLGWDHRGGSPRRLDAVLNPREGGRTVAALRRFGPQFQTKALIEEPIRVDLTKPIEIESEIHKGNVTARIAGFSYSAPLGLDPNRPVIPFIGAGSATWKVLEWQVQDLEPAGSPVPEEPWIDLLQSAELHRAAASGLRRQAGVLILDSKGESRAAQTAIESLKVKHARMRLTAQAVDSQPQEMLALGWTHGEGTPRRLDAVLQSFRGDRNYAHLWQFGPQFELTNLVKSPAIAVDWTAPVVVECEIHDGTMTANVAGASLKAVQALDPARPVMPYIGGTGSWKILEWKLQDLAPQAEIVPVNFNGAWDSGWGVVSFQHAPVNSDQPFDLEGEYEFHGKGIIQGTVDPKTRTFKGRFQETTLTGGRLLLTLSPDGNSITGWYDYQNEPIDGSPPRLSWNMTRRPNPLDFSGDWDSRWGVVTFAHPVVNDLLPVAMTGKYYSGKGIIEGTADPRSRTFAGAFREATGMSGRITLQLTADGQHILGRYEYSNTPGTVYEWDMTRSGAPASALSLENRR